MKSNAKRYLCGKMKMKMKNPGENENGNENVELGHSSNRASQSFKM